MPTFLQKFLFSTFLKEDIIQFESYMWFTFLMSYGATVWASAANSNLYKLKTLFFVHHIFISLLMT